MRRSHVIQKTGKREFPQAVICVQCKTRQRYLGEADDVGHLALTEWHASVGILVGKSPDWRDEHKGTESKSFWAWLEEVIAEHNTVWLLSWQAREVIAALDLWEQIESGRWTLDGADPYYKPESTDRDKSRGSGYVILESPPTIVCCKSVHSDATCVWLDPANYGVKSLSKWADSVDVAEYGPEEWEKETWFAGPKAQALVYACETWLWSYFQFIIGLDMGGPEYTAASQARQAFTHRYMHEQITIHDSKPAIDMEREALYGGRCEATFLGVLEAGNKPGILSGMHEDTDPVRYDQGPIWHLDVNSMYAYVAKDLMIPVKLRGICGSVSQRLLVDACKVTGIIARVNVKTAVACVPMRHGGQTLWPIGEFPTVLCGPEILLADSCNASLKCVQLVMYEARPIYHYYVDILYSAREQFIASGNLGMAATCKMLLNASFGKWCQKSRRWVDVPDAIPPCPYSQWSAPLEGTDKLQSWRSLAWRVQKLAEQGETNESFPAITAYINSAGRVRLYALLRTAGLANVFYYDTDSLFVNQAGMDNLHAAGEMHPTGLGMLKVVAEHHRMHVYGRQAYNVDGSIVLSGAKCNVRTLGDITVETLKAPPIQHYLLKDKAPGIDRHVARVSVVRNYRLGNVHSDGSVTPVRFS